MASYILQEDGSRILLEDGSGDLLLEVSAPTQYGAVAWTTTDAITLVGTRRPVGAFTLGITDVLQAAGVRKAVGVVALAITDTLSVAGVPKRFGTVAFTETATFVVVPHLRSYGLVSLVITPQFMVAGIGYAPYLPIAPDVVTLELVPDVVETDSWALDSDGDRIQMAGGEGYLILSAGNWFLTQDEDVDLLTLDPAP